MESRSLLNLQESGEVEVPGWWSRCLNRAASCAVFFGVVALCIATLIAFAPADSAALSASAGQWRPGRRVHNMEVTTLDTPPQYSPQLLAYWDAGACGPRGDDFNLAWCGAGQAMCAECIHVDARICPTGKAYLAKQHGSAAGGGAFRPQLSIAGCQYALFAVYACVASQSAVELRQQQLYHGQPDLLGENCSQDEPLVYIGIMSSPHHFHRREAVRQDWLAAAVDPWLAGCVVAEFVVGTESPLRKGQQVQERLREEATRFGDVRQVPLEDTYINLPDKALFVLQEGLRRGARFVVKVDDDQRLFLPRVLGLAQQWNPTSHVYAAPQALRGDSVEEVLGDASRWIEHLGAGAWLFSSELAQRVALVDSLYTTSYATWGHGVADLDVQPWVRHAAKHVNVTFVEAQLSGPLGGDLCAPAEL